jgi:hypothetical protein
MSKERALKLYTVYNLIDLDLWFRYSVKLLVTAKMPESAAPKVLALLLCCRGAFLVPTERRLR